MTKVLLIGADGQLGRLMAQMKPENISLHSCTRENLDITDQAAVKKIIEQISPNIIINTAAYTAVDNAEKDQKTAFRVNADAVANIAQSANEKTRIIHISTDFVFSRTSTRPYTPEDLTCPVSVYGESKLAGEQALLTFHPNNSIIIRTSWLYSSLTKNFVTTMLTLMGSRDELNVVNDQYGSPTSALNLAKIIWDLACVESAQGIYHWSDSGVITWYDFAVEIQKQARQLGILHSDINIKPIPTSAFPTPATRPEYSALDCSKTEVLLGQSTAAWQDQLHQVLSDIKKANLN
jgi:dTDP-4-dehydrorhamnose reductase